MEMEVRRCMCKSTCSYSILKIHNDFVRQKNDPGYFEFDYLFLRTKVDTFLTANFHSRGI